MCQKASRHEVAESSFIRAGGALRRFKHLQTLLPLLPDSAELRSADQHPVNQLSTNQEGGGRRRRRGYTSSRISLAEPHRTTCFPWPHRPWDGGRSFQKKLGWREGMWVGVEGWRVGCGLALHNQPEHVEQPVGFQTQHIIAQELWECVGKHMLAGS